MFSSGNLINPEQIFSTDFKLKTDLIPSRVKVKYYNLENHLDLIIITVRFGSLKDLIFSAKKTGLPSVMSMTLIVGCF